MNSNEEYEKHVRETKKFIARNMKKDRKSLKEIAEYMDMTQKDVKELLKEK